MKIDLRKVRKAVAAAVVTTITAGVTAVITSLGLDPEFIVLIDGVLVAAATKLVHRIPNKVEF